MTNYALALWGWASRWLAHIWVLQFIEEQNIMLDEISGTSMWAIIAWAYAIGKNSQEIIQIVENIDYLKLVDLNLKDGIVSGKKVYDLLENIFWETKIESLKIKLKITATNLKTWEKKVFTSGKITDAIRASISLPSIFQPFEIDGNLYLDWWLKSNLPILCLENTNIIAVSVIRGDQVKIKTHKKIWIFELKRSFWTFNYDILKQTIAHMMTQNEDNEIEISSLKGKNITLIAPKVGNYEYFDFKKFKEIIQKWYDEAKSVVGK